MPGRSSASRALDLEVTAQLAGRAVDEILLNPALRRTDVLDAAEVRGGPGHRHSIAVDENHARIRIRIPQRDARGALDNHGSTRDHGPGQQRRGRGLDERGGQGFEAGVLLLSASVQLVEEVRPAHVLDVAARIEAQDERRQQADAGCFEPSQSGMVTYAL